jgi:predicted phage terminase large subunit-like protein
MISFDKFFQATSPETFEQPWHLKLIGKYLERVERRSISNLMIFTPPQHGKSTTVAERYPAYHFARDPLSHVLLCSYSDDLAVRASVNTRQIVQSDWFQETYGFPIGKATESRWMFNVPGQDGRYSCVASGIAGSITGHTADTAVIDDVLRNRMDALSPTIRENIWQNYTSSVESRLPKDGRVVLITTRWHADDLPGRLLTRAKENKKSSQWTVLVLPATNDSGEEAYILDTKTGEQQFLPKYEALWPSHFPREVLEQRRADLGEGLWQALYMCRPSMGANILFPADKWGIDDRFVPVAIVQAWDSASKAGSANDFSVCCTVGLDNSGRFQVLDVWRGKVDFTALKRQVFIQWAAAYQRWRLYPGVVIEDANAGQQLLQEIENLNATDPTLVQPVAVKPTKNKFVRSEAIASYQNAGQVSLPSEAPWKQAFIRELEEFPLAQHDDQVDAYTWAQAAFVRGQGVFKLPKDIEGPSEVVHLDDLADYSFGDSFDSDFEQFTGGSGEWISPATQRALNKWRP